MVRVSTDGCSGTDLCRGERLSQGRRRIDDQGDTACRDAIGHAGRQPAQVGRKVGIGRCGGGGDIDGHRAGRLTLQRHVPPAREMVFPPVAAVTVPLHWVAMWRRSVTVTPVAGRVSVKARPFCAGLPAPLVTVKVRVDVPF